MSKKFLITILVLVLLVGGFFIVKNFTGNVVKEGSKKEINLENNCECIEKEKVICFEGYNLMDEKRLCEKVSEKCFTGELNEIYYDFLVHYTLVLLCCSEYD